MYFWRSQTKADDIIVSNNCVANEKLCAQGNDICQNDHSWTNIGSTDSSI